MHILVIEDDERVSGLLSGGLHDLGYTVTVAADGEKGYLTALVNNHDLLILDLAVPTMGGLAIVRALRAQRKHVPILMLASHDSERDRIAGLEAGADDYLGKPFSFEELMARVRALLRRESLIRASVMRFGDLELDTAQRQVRRSGREITLSAREFALLEYLAHNAGKVVTRRVLAEHVWGDAAAESNVIDVYVRYLRKKVDAGSSASLITTVRGVGYALHMQKEAVTRGTTKSSCSRHAPNVPRARS